MPGDPSGGPNPSAERLRLATLAPSSRLQVSPGSHLALAEPTPLVDRVEELAIIRRKLTVEGVRLLTLVGPGGVGKTRLALDTAAQVADTFPDGVVLVDLAPAHEPQQVVPAIAQALAFTDTGPRPLEERLLEFLRERALLAVLDNFEQVLPAASQLATLLASCPYVVVLVTSRVPLWLRWEHVLRVAPLPVPDLTALPPLDDLMHVPSVELFLARARARQADFALTEARAPLVAQLTVHLDGLPLALELAAARLDVLSLPMVVRRLGARLDLLASPAPDAPERQRSLEAAVGWSYDLLRAEEQRLFRHLGVFVGGVSPSAIAAVLGDADPEAVLGGLEALAEQSLIVPTQEDELDQHGWPIFWVLETVRKYAEEQLAAAGELVAAHRAHAHYFLALAEQADPLLRGPDQRSWYLRLGREQDNLRAALRWLLDGGDRADRDGPAGSAAAAERAAGLRLAAALGYFWWRRGYHVEGLRWLEEALARTAAAAGTAGEGAEATDPSVRTRALLFAGALLQLRGEFARARAALGEALALAERRQDPAAAAWAHTYLGLGAVTGGEVPEAARLLGEARRRWEAVGDVHGLGETCFCLGVAADLTGDADAAVAQYTAALEHLSTIGDVQGMAYARCYLGAAQWKRGELSSAVEHIWAALRTGIALQDRWFLGAGAQVAVALVSERADPAARARLLGATDALAQASGATFIWVRMPGRQDVAEMREQLAREEAGEWAAAYRAGRALPFAEVVALALRLLEDVSQALPHPETDVAPGSPPSPECQSQHPHQSPLTAREQEVLQLVAQGLPNKAIARQLVISPSTVNYHLTSIFHKLGVDTRAQAVAVAAQRALL
jgi:non-specific serine/threonine protein kinase